MLDYPVTSNNKVDITNLTHATIDGNGVFDVLMRTVNAHLQKEWTANRLKGTEYSTVYLGALESTMNTSLQFLLAKDKLNAELAILEQQLDNLKVEEINATKQGLLLDKQLDDLVAATALKIQQKANLVDELLTNAQQRSNLATEQARIAAQTSQINAETSQIAAQTSQINAETSQIAAQTSQINTQTAQIAAQTAQINAETQNVPKQGALIDAQKDVQVQQKLNLEAQKLNIPKEGALVDAQKVLTEQKVLAEIDASLTAAAQRSVLAAQATGFANDAKQKAAEIMIKGFSVVSTTNDLTQIQSADYGVSTTKVKAALDALVS